HRKGDLAQHRGTGLLLRGGGNGVGRRGGPQDRAGVGLGARRQNRQRDAGQHEQHGAHDGGFAQGGLRSPRPEGGLAAHASKGGGDVAGFAALQQNDGDQKQADQNVQ